LVLVCSTFALSLPITFPGADWETRTPAEVGVDAMRIDQFAASVGGDGCIVKDGYIIKTWGNQSKADWASAAKPVIATMLFFAIQEGKLTGVNDLVDPWWDNALIDKDKTMTFRHLADMTSGYARAEAPGTAFAYNDYAIQLYARTLFDKVFGEGLANTAATKPERLGAIGFQDGSIFSSRGGYGLSTTPRDFARIGWFWCNKGYWDGVQVLDKRFFDNYLKPDVPWDLPRSTGAGTDYLGLGSYGGGSDQSEWGQGIYGFNWWFNAPMEPNGPLAWPDAPADLFMANGHWNKELCVVIPSRGIVAAARGYWGTLSPGDSNATMNQYLKLLTDAVIMPVDEPPSATDMKVNLITKYLTSSCSSGLWFGWQGEQQYKPMLEIVYELEQVPYINVYQHGFNGLDDAHAFFIKEDGGWDGDDRELHKHNISQQAGAVRHGLFKCDISDIPPDANIVEATLHLHIHSEEGIRRGSCGVIGFFECTKEWNWDTVDWFQYGDGLLWDAEGGDYGVKVKNLWVIEDIRNQGYGLTNNQFPLDLTDYVIALQHNRLVALSENTPETDPGL
jgi:CubicO group peptidase (beta-lactamase class C family)